MTLMDKNDSPLLGARILVTGGGGFLGKALIQRLLKYTTDIRSLSRSRYEELSVIGVEQVLGDIKDKNQVSRACQGRDFVFHAAAKTNMWGIQQDFYDTNVIGTRNIIQACKKNSVPYLIYTSSPSVVHHDNRDVMGVDESEPYPDQYQTHYQATKAEAEQEVIKNADSDLSVIVLRPHLIWGPGDTQFVPRILQRAKYLRRVGDGQNRIDTIFIDNATLAHILAAEKLTINKALSGKVYFISQGEQIYLWDMVNHILTFGGKKPVTKSIPLGLAYYIGWLMEGIYGLFRIRSEPRMTRFLANQLARHHWFDIRAAKRDLGYEPEVGLEDGLKQLKKWMETWT